MCLRRQGVRPLPSSPGPALWPAVTVELRTPFQARHFLDTMRGLFRWAVEAELVKSDPTLGVSDPTMPKTDGFEPWTEADVELYRRRWPIGTRQCVWLEVLIGTGLRRGDAVMLGRQHVRDSVTTIKTEKTDTEVTIPISPELAEILSIGPTGDLHFICNALGKPFTKEFFRQCIFRSLSQGWHQEIGSRLTQTCCRTSCTRRRHRARAGCDDGLDRRTHGSALHARSRWSSSRACRCKQIAEVNRQCLFYSLTLGFGAPHLKSSIVISIGYASKIPQWWAVTDSNRRHSACKQERRSEKSRQIAWSRV